MEQMDNLLEDWPGSLDILGSVWINALGMSRTTEGWSLCLNLVELLCLDLLTQVDFLLEHQAVCFTVLGPLFTDDLYVWMFLQN